MSLAPVLPGTPVQANPLNLIPMPHYHPGDVVPESGIYSVEHDTVHKTEHEVTVIEGKTFPPCRQCKHVTYTPIRMAVHLHSHAGYRHAKTKHGPGVYGALQGLMAFEKCSRTADPAVRKEREKAAIARIRRAVDALEKTAKKHWKP